MGGGCDSSRSSAGAVNTISPVVTITITTTITLPQAGITPLERRSDVAPKRGRPPKPKLPDPSAPPALPSAGDASGSAKRRAVGDEADALDGSDGAQVARDLTEDLAGNAADEGSEEEA